MLSYSELDERPIAERHRREDVVSGPALEEQLDHGLIACARGFPARNNIRRSFASFLR